jgi:hypothetical protein
MIRAKLYDWSLVGGLDKIGLERDDREQAAEPAFARCATLAPELRRAVEGKGSAMKEAERRPERREGWEGKEKREEGFQWMRGVRLKDAVGV